MTVSVMQTLDKLKKGKRAIIREVKCDDKVLRRHILDMGLTPNVEVTMIKAAPMGDPLQINVRGYELTLRKADAAKIQIEPCSVAKNCQCQNSDVYACGACPYKDIEAVIHSKKGETATYENISLKKPLKQKLKFALVGNQNSGKTTLFNQLTGMNQHVGNFPGVTVDRTDGIIRGNSDVTITDLPGIYSLSPYSNEEIVTRNFILDEKPDAIINIIDATNIERNLLLTMQLIELNVPLVIALNMMDEIKHNNGSIDINGLEEELGVPVVPISAAKNQGIDELIEHALNIARYEGCPKKLDFCEERGKGGAIHRSIHSIIHLTQDHAEAANLPLRFAATKLIEGDELVLNALELEDKEISTIENIVLQMEKETNLDRDAAIADMRFDFIEKLCREFVRKPAESKEHKISKNIDKILTGKFTALAAFLVIMAFVFYMTFGPFGLWLTDLAEKLIGSITQIVDNGLTAYGLNPVVQSLIIDGIFAGVGGVLSFLPVIVILFFFLSILEDSGYMARVAFVMDKLLRKIGLSGQSFVPLLIGFGCSVPAIMATRTLPSERDRKMTILLTPFMSCSAKLPIYALFTAAFFSRYQVEVIIGLYLIGIVVGIMFAYIIKLFTKGNPVPFVMELPNYRMPNTKSVIRLIWTKTKGFITKAFTIIFVATILIWFLQTFDYQLNLADSSENSLLAMLGSTIAPLFAPLGLESWKISTAFLTGFMAKESVISTLTVLMDGNVENLQQMFTPLTAFVFLVFSLLYTPCIATITMVKKELGKRYALGVVAVQCLIAWLAAYAVYHIGSVFWL